VKIYSQVKSNVMKKLIYLTSLVGMGLFVNSCSLGYVSTEPVYVENVRPARPSNMHIWIDGDWVYNRQTNAYARNAGYWEMQRQNRSYVSGQWQNGTRGKYWQRGHWQKNNSRLRQDRDSR
jgi:hypothetical protein